MTTASSELLQPRLRDLPGLGWVSARAYGPNKAVAATTWVIDFSHIVYQHLRGDVRAIDRHALMIISPLQHRPLRNLVAALCTGAVMVMLIGCAELIVAVFSLGLVGLGAPEWTPDAALFASVIALTVAFLWRGGIVGPIKGERNIKKVAAQSALNKPVWKGGGFAAWPRGEGHGTHLMSTLLGTWTPEQGTILGSPRDARVRAYYLRHGMRPHPSDKAVLVYDGT